jgi:hypothetical protein
MRHDRKIYLFYERDLRNIEPGETNTMKQTVRRTIAFLGATWMAAQMFTALPANAAPFRGSSTAFEQAMPVTSAQKDVERLFKQININAVIASRHADRLDSFNRVNSRVHSTTHASELNGAKEAINAIGSDYRKLLELRPGALPWQQSVIDRLEPVLVGMAGQTTEAIALLNEERGPITSQEYRDAVGSLYGYAGRTQTLISANLDYAQAREKLNRLDATSEEPWRRSRRRANPRNLPRHWNSALPASC